MAKYEFNLSIGFVNGNRKEIIDIADEDIENLSEEELEKYLEQYWKDWSNNYIEGSFHKVK